MKALPVEARVILPAASLLTQLFEREQWVEAIFCVVGASWNQSRETAPKEFC